MSKVRKSRVITHVTSYLYVPFKNLYFLKIIETELVTHALSLNLELEDHINCLLSVALNKYLIFMTSNNNEFYSGPDLFGTIFG